MGLEILRVLFQLFTENALADISVREIAERMNKTPQLVESVVRQLLVHGFVERSKRPSPDHLYVRIAPEGIAMLRK